MRVFIVSLKKDSDRLAKVAKQLDALGVPYECFPAIYGKEIPSDEKDKIVNRFMWRCIIGQPPTDGEIGCALSHVRLYEKIRAENIPMACVLEDDVILNGRFPKQLLCVQEFCAQNDDSVVLLTDKYHTGGDEWGISQIVQENGTYGYVITRKAAAALVAANTPLIVPSDGWKWLCRNCKTKIYKASPAVCDYDRSYVSQTGSGRIAVSDMSFFGKIRYKVLRALGLMWAHLSA